MFHWFNRLIAKTLMCSPSIGYIKPKVLNVYFKNSKDKKFTHVDLSECDVIDLNIVTEKNESNDNEFILFLNKDDLKIELGVFENKKDAESALLDVRVKLFSIEKALIKFTIMATFLIFVWGVLADIMVISIQRLKGSVESQPVAMSPNSQPQVNPEDVAALLAYQQNRLAQGNAPQPEVAQPSVVQSGNPAVSDFMQGLKK